LKAAKCGSEELAGLRSSCGGRRSPEGRDIGKVGALHPRQLSIAKPTSCKPPSAKEVDDFTFKDTPIKEALVRDLAAGNFIAQRRDVALVGDAGAGKPLWRSPSREAASATASAPSQSRQNGSRLAENMGRRFNARRHIRVKRAGRLKAATTLSTCP